MRGIIPAVALCLLPIVATSATAQSASSTEQIRQATSALPAVLRADATVIRYDAKGLPVVLRQGTNGIFCTPNTSTDSFAVACRSMMTRPTADFQAKEKAAGKDAKAIAADTDAAYASGSLKRPAPGSITYLRNGKTEAEAKPMWVVFIPNAKAEDLGLPAKRVNSTSPWMMLSGTPRAHIMMPQTASMDELPPPAKGM